MREAHRVFVAPNLRDGAVSKEIFYQSKKITIDSNTLLLSRKILFDLILKQFFSPFFSLYQIINFD